MTGWLAIVSLVALGMATTAAFRNIACFEAEEKSEHRAELLRRYRRLHLSCIDRPCSLCRETNEELNDGFVSETSED